MNDALDAALRTAEELDLETRGRRTGRAHRVAVWFAYDPPDIWLRTDRDADWLRNLERDPQCRITVGGIGADATRVAVDDETAALLRLIALWRTKYGQEWVADWYVERGRVPVRIRLSRA